MTTPPAKGGEEGNGDIPPVEAPPTKSEKTVLARNITSDWHIETTDDLDKYLETMRKQIQAQLDDDHIVIIKF